MTGKELIALMKKNGWKLDRIEGSHHVMVKDGNRIEVISFHGNRDLPTGMLHSILKRTGLKP